uniref:Uncharacterized protein n=1 Tax=Anguilla anguilla TaxID=7936 RepID=A0A0E9Q127_ANGAN
MMKNNFLFSTHRGTCVSADSCLTTNKQVVLILSKRIKKKIKNCILILLRALKVVHINVFFTVLGV